MTTTIERPEVDAPPAPPKRARKTASAPTSTNGLVLTIPQSDLKEALGVVTRAAAGDRAMPILRYVRLVATGQRLELGCTDLEIGLLTSADATVEREGAWCVDARQLAGYIATLPSQPVSLRVDTVTAILHVECGRSKAAIKGTGIEEFPALADPPAAPTLTVPASTLRRALALTQFSANQDSSTGVLHNVHLASDGLYALIAEAADGLRLTALKEHFEQGVVAFSILLPGHGATAVAKLLDGAGGDAEVWLLPSPASPNVITLRVDGTTLTARLSEGQFPPVQRLIPRQAKATIAVSRTNLLAALRQVMMFAPTTANKDGKGQFQLVVISPAGEDTLSSLTIAADAVERGAGTAELFATVTGEMSRFGLNGPFLRQLLEALPGDEVTIHVTDWKSPIRITDATLPGYDAVIMPMSIPGEKA